MTADTRVQSVELDSISLSITTRGDGPAVLLLHGFPEIAYSWRHQIEHLADAGLRAIAPDQRGYGWSDLPEPVEAYSILELVGDAVGVLDAEGIDQAVVVGHDWGSIVAWHLALMRPDRVRGLALMSVPYQPRVDRSIVEHIRATDPEGPFAYMLFFQDEGVAESMMDPDPVGVLRSAHWKNSGAWPEDADDTTPVPDELPPHLTDGDMENYGRAFARSGFRGGLNWYRNLDRNWELTRPWHRAPLTPPTTFIGGRRDFVVSSADGGLGSTVAAMAQSCSDFRGFTLIDGAGHWVQQESPRMVSDALISFIDGLD